MERRTFILATGSLLGAGLHGTAAPAATIGTGSTGGASALNRASFAALLNQSFNVYDSHRGVTMQLIALQDRHGSERRQQFTLTFAAPAGVTLPSGTYDVEPAGGAMLQLYLEASGSGPQGPYYRADFSLLN